MGEHDVRLHFDFKCPRRHGILQQVRGVPMAYAIRQGTDDLTLTCSNCERGEIEEDPKLFHCPKFGCCYDLCLLCAQNLVQHQHPDPRASALERMKGHRVEASVVPD